MIYIKSVSFCVKFQFMAFIVYVCFPVWIVFLLWFFPFPSKMSRQKSVLLRKSKPEREIIAWEFFFFFILTRVHRTQVGFQFGFQTETGPHTFLEYAIKLGNPSSLSQIKVLAKKFYRPNVLFTIGVRWHDRQNKGSVCFLLLFSGILKIYIDSSAA